MNYTGLVRRHQLLPRHPSSSSIIQVHQLLTCVECCIISILITVILMASKSSLNVLKYVGSPDLWMELAQDRDRWQALVGTVRNLRVPKMR